MNYPESFNAIISETVSWETGGDKAGGYTDDPKDAGGQTKWGISKRAFPDLNIEELTYKEAIAIYYSMYWNSYYTFIADPMIQFKLFDLGVLFGPKTAVRYIQQSIVVAGNKTIKIDGVFGPITSAALAVILTAGEGEALLKDYLNRFKNRIFWIVLVKPWNIRFRRGWLNRINHEPRLETLKNVTA